MSFAAFRRYANSVGIALGPGDGPSPEEQRSDYESGIVRLPDGLWRLRTARVTPTKPGAFAAVWERGEDGRTRPLQASDGILGLLVFVEVGERSGVFRFTSADLVRLGVARTGSQPGKRGFRLYPAWCSDLNPAARRTQREQAPSFTSLVEPQRA